jgi:hypothetical protein
MWLSVQASFLPHLTLGTQLVTQVPLLHVWLVGQPDWPLVQQPPLGMHMVPHSVRSEGQALLHGWVSGMQAVPHLRPEVHCTSQAPFTQTAWPPVAVQARQVAPQALGSSSGRQLPLQLCLPAGQVPLQACPSAMHLPAHRVVRAGQLPLHTVPLQVAVPPVGASQGWPHDMPQVATSMLETHIPSQL